MKKVQASEAILLMEDTSVGNKKGTDCSQLWIFTGKRYHVCVEKAQLSAISVVADLTKRTVNRMTCSI